MQQLYAWSGLWRPISWHSLPHRLILICMLVAALLAGLTYLQFFVWDPAGALIFGLRMGLGVFLSWALARELSPDAPWAAFVSVGLTSVALWFWPAPNLLLLFLMLLCLRLVNRSSGTAGRWADSLLLLGLTGLLLYQGHLLAGALATAAFWANSRLPAPQLHHRYLALLALLGTLISASLKPYTALPDYLTIETNILIIALATGFALYMRRVKQVQATDDAAQALLNLKRVRTAQALALLIATVFCLWQGDLLFQALSPLWAAFGAVFLYAAAAGRPAKRG